MIRKYAVCLMALFLLLGAFAGCRPEEVEEPFEEIPAVNEDEEPGYRRTVLHFEDENGYIVPVMKKIKLVEGIGKAALNELKESASAPLRDMGLYAVLSDDAEIDLDVSGRLATLDLNKDAYQAHNALEESNRITALVNTLTEFSTVDRVQFLVEGKKEAELPYGTDIGEPIARSDINPESAEAELDLQNAAGLTLYFADKENTHIVPVTRYVQAEADVAAAVSELIKGPTDAAFLQCAFPEGTSLLKAELGGENILHLDFSKEFLRLQEDPEAEKNAVKTLYLTCLAFDKVEDVNILVEGAAYEGAAAAMAAPQFPNAIR